MLRRPTDFTFVLAEFGRYLRINRPLQRFPNPLAPRTPKCIERFLSEGQQSGVVRVAGNQKMLLDRDTVRPQTAEIGVREFGPLSDVVSSGERTQVTRMCPMGMPLKRESNSFKTLRLAQTKSRWISGSTSSSWSMCFRRSRRLFVVCDAMELISPADSIALIRDWRAIVSDAPLRAVVTLWPTWYRAKRSLVRERESGSPRGR